MDKTTFWNGTINPENQEPLTTARLHAIVEKILAEDSREEAAAYNKAVQDMVKARRVYHWYIRRHALPSRLKPRIL